MIPGLPPQEPTVPRIAKKVLDADKGIPGGVAPLESDGLVDPEYLGTGTASATTYLRGDGTWTTPGGSGDVVGPGVAVTDQNIVAFNGTTGTSIEELTGTQGDVLYHSGTQWQKLAAGTDGYVLGTQGSGANPRWIPAAATRYVDNEADLHTALAALTSGGTVVLAAGTYHITTPIVIAYGGITLRGAGRSVTKIWYDATANDDIITIAHSACTVEDLSVYGADPATATNGSGQVGTGCGIKIAQPDSGSGGPAWNYCADPAIRRVGVYCTPSWSICDIGIATPANFSTDGNFTYPTTATNKTISVRLAIEDTIAAFPNSGGALYIGSGASAPTITAFTTNAYSYGTYTRVTSAVSPVAVNRGSVHLYNVVDATFENKCIFQSPTAQGSGTAVDHYDNDATMLSLQHSSVTRLVSPYFEVLSANCAGTHPDGGSPAGSSSAGRQNWFITSVNSTGTYIDHPYFRSAVVNPGATDDGYPLRIMETPVDPDIQNGVTIVGGAAYQYRQWYSTGLGRAPSAPYGEGDFVTWDRDDFCFRAPDDGLPNTPINIHGMVVINLETGALREPTTPASPTNGFNIVYRTGARIDGSNRTFHLPPWKDVDLTGTDPTMDDMRVRVALGSYAPLGSLGYASGGSSADGAVQREGLWGYSARDNDVRQIPWIRVHTSAWSPVYAGDLWMRMSSASGGVYTKADFNWYDGGRWVSATEMNVPMHFLTMGG